MITIIYVIKAIVAVMVFIGLTSIMFDKESDNKDVLFAIVCQILIQIAIWG